MKVLNIGFLNTFFEILEFYINFQSPKYSPKRGILNYFLEDPRLLSELEFERIFAGYLLNFDAPADLQTPIFR